MIPTNNDDSTEHQYVYLCGHFRHVFFLAEIHLDPVTWPWLVIGVPAGQATEARAGGAVVHVRLTGRDGGIGNHRGVPHP